MNEKEAVGPGSEEPDMVRLRITMRRLRDTVVSIDPLVESFSRDMQQWIETVASEELMRLKESSSACHAWMSHTDPEKREIAVFLIEDYWGCPPEYLSDCIHLALHDPIVKVRESAICTVGFYAKLYGFVGEAGRCLASIVRSETETPALRMDAYLSLCIAAQRTPTINQQGNYVASVDWAFVDSLL
jgi:hypothetical protein